MLIPRTKISVLAAVALLFVFSLVSCKDSESGSPTAPGSATVMGTVVNGDDPASPALSGVSVRVLRTGQVTQTDAGGNFTITGVPAGDQQLQFSRGDVDARGTIAVANGTTVAVIAAISKRKTVVITPRGDTRPDIPAQTGTPTAKVEQIEGIVTANDGSTLAIFDQRLGTVMVNVTGTTIIRKGQTALTAAEILVGWRVHVKALFVSPGVYTALEIIVQNENITTVTPSPAAATATPTATATSSPVPATATPTATVTDTPTAAPTNTPTVSPTSTVTNTASPSDTPTFTPTPSNTPTLTPTT